MTRAVIRVIGRLEQIVRDFEGNLADENLPPGIKLGYRLDIKALKDAIELLRKCNL